MGALFRLRWPGGHLRAFTLSYDDGCLEDFILAEMLDKYGARGTFNISFATLWDEERPAPEKNPNRRKMRRSEFREFVRQYGDRMEIASHALTHPVLQTLTPAQQALEIIENRRLLEEVVGKPVLGFVFSMSHKDADLAMEPVKLSGALYFRSYSAKKDFSYTEGDPLGLPATCHHNVPEETLQKYADDFLALSDDDKQDGALYFVWGHTYEFARNDDWYKMEHLLEKVGNRDDVWYATNGEIASYIAAYRALVFSVDGTMVQNPTATPVYLRARVGKAKEGKTVCVHPGELLRLTDPEGES